MACSKKHNYFLLCKAIERGDEAIAKYLLQNSVDINEAQLKNSVILHLAITKFYDTDIITLLFEKGANIHGKDDKNRKPLHIAIQHDRTDAASLLIEKGALVGEDMNLLLLEAINRSNDIIVKTITDYILENNVSTNLNISLKAAISQRNPLIIDAIIPHCGFSRRCDLHIPGNLVMKSNQQSRETIDLLLQWNFIFNPNEYYDEDFIYEVFRNGHLQIAKDLLKTGINVNMVNQGTKLNLLTIACLNAHYELVKQLLEHNANVNVEIYSEREMLKKKANLQYHVRKFSSLFPMAGIKNKLINLTCLHIAVFNSDSLTVDILLEYGAKITDDANFFNLISYAIRNNFVEVVNVFLNHGVNATDTNSSGTTLLHSCIQYYSQNKRDFCYSTAKLLLQKGASIHLHVPFNKYVSEAIKNQNFNIAQLFLDYNADVQYTGKFGHTVLHRAIKCGCSSRLVKTLLEHGIPVNTVDYFGYTPVLDACNIATIYQFEILEALVEYSADIDYMDVDVVFPDEYNIENLPLVEMLPHRGINLHHVNPKGRTPLHCICKIQRNMTVDIIELLLEYGANIEAVDHIGWTPLFVACENRNYEAIECLLEYGANPNHIGAQNLTPLHLLVNQLSVPMQENDYLSKLYESYEFIQLLIKYGASIDIVDENNQTPLHMAVSKYIFREDLRHNSSFVKSMEKIIKILASHGIKLKTAGLEINNYDSNLVYDTEVFITINNTKYSLNNILRTNSQDKGIEDFDDKNSTGDLQQLKSQCEQEIKQMKKKSIGIDHLTFYDLLKGNIYCLRNFFQNDHIQQYLKIGVYDDTFPLYIDIVKNRLRYAKVDFNEYMMRLTARASFTMNISQHLPDECVDRILNNLNIEEIVMFIETISQLYVIDD